MRTTAEANRGWVGAQVVNSIDLEGILGPRPWRSNELRNIDKFREGFGKARSVTEASQEVPPAAL